MHGQPFPPPTVSAVNFPVSASDLAGFTAAFVALNRLLPSDAQMIEPVAARVAYMPSNHMHWGVATFVTRPGADHVLAELIATPRNLLVFVQPEQGCPWTFHDGPTSVPFPCPDAQDIPVGVQDAWHLTSPSPQACAHRIRPPAPR